MKNTNKNKILAYKIPKNGDFNKLEMADLDDIPELADKRTHFYFFFNTKACVWNIPQLCNNRNKNEVTKLKELFCVIKNQDNLASSEEVEDLTSFALSLIRTTLDDLKIIIEKQKKKKKEKEERLAKSKASDFLIVPHQRYYRGVWNSEKRKKNKSTKKNTKHF
mgnify:CR=1 FL=1